MSNSKLLPYTMFTILGIFWGSNFLFMKIVVGIIQPLQVAWLRTLFGTLPILLFALLKKQMKWQDLRWSHHYLVMALLNNVVPFYLLVKSTQYLPSGVAGVFSGTVPLMTTLLVVISIPSERLTAKKALGLTLGLIGVVLLSHLEAIFSMGANREVVGASYMLAGGLCFALAMVYAKKFIIPLKLKPLSLAAYQTIVASLILTLVTPFSGVEALASDFWALTCVVIGLGLLGTGIAYVMYYYIIDTLGAITASSVYYVPPLVALLVGAIFAGEVISFSQFLGTLAIVLGIYFSRTIPQKV